MVVSTRGITDYEKMLADDVRMSAYHRAIAAVCPGKIVCEIGVGLGPLSLMALNAGAKVVYGIDAVGAPLEAATEVIRAAGYGPDRFVPLRGMSTAITLPQRADVILSETLDHLGVGENTAATMRDAHRRLLAPGGVFLPAGLGCFVALARPQAWDQRSALWAESLPERYGLDYTPLRAHLRWLNYSMDVRPEEILSPWQVWQTIDFSSPDSFQAKRRLLVQAQSAGVVEGLAVAFVAFLCDGIELSTLPDAPPTHWKQGFQPLPKAVEVEAGDGFQLDLGLHDTEQGLAGLSVRARHIPVAEIPEFVADMRRKMEISELAQRRR
jgi:hypothetical protein